MSSGICKGCSYWGILSIRTIKAFLELQFISIWLQDSVCSEVSQEKVYLFDSRDGFRLHHEMGSSTALDSRSWPILRYFWVVYGFCWRMWTLPCFL